MSDEPAASQEPKLKGLGLIYGETPQNILDTINSFTAATAGVEMSWVVLLKDGVDAGPLKAHAKLKYETRQEAEYEQLAYLAKIWHPKGAMPDFVVLTHEHAYAINYNVLGPYIVDWVGKGMALTACVGDTQVAQPLSVFGGALIRAGLHIYNESGKHPAADLRFAVLSRNGVNLLVDRNIIPATPEVRGCGDAGMYLSLMLGVYRAPQLRTGGAARPAPPIYKAPAGLGIGAHPLALRPEFAVYSDITEIYGDCPFAVRSMYGRHRQTQTSSK